MIRTASIVTGLFLFAYVTMHLANLALGLVSLDVMESARPYIMAPWTNPVVGSALIASLAVHGSLGLYSLYRRNTLSMAAPDIVQLLFGLAVVPLLVPHIVGTFIAFVRFDIPPSYYSLIPYFWVYEPAEGLRQVFVLVVVWIHGAVGVTTWLRLKPWWQRVSAFANPLFVAVPVLALLGFVEAGKEVLDPERLAEIQASPVYDVAGNVVESAPVTSAVLDQLAMMNWILLGIYALAVAGVLIARAIRLSAERNKTVITYKDGPRIAADASLTILEMARVGDVQHANLCRGRARCGTCAVRILDSDHPLPPVSEEEQATIARRQLPDDARLACRLKPGPGKLTIERIMPPNIRPKDIAKPAAFPESAEDEAEPA